MKKRIICLFILVFVMGIIGTACTINRLSEQKAKAFFDDRLEEALEIQKKIYEINKESHDYEGMAGSLESLGFLNSRLGRYDEALSLNEEALKIAREHKFPERISAGLDNIGKIFYALGRYDEAIVNFEEALKIKRSLPVPSYTMGTWADPRLSISYGLNDIGLVYLSMHNFREAEEKFLEAKRLTEKIKNEVTVPLTLIELYIATGRYEKVLSMITDAYVNNDNSGFYTHKGLAFKGTGRFREASHEFLEAVLLTEDARQKIKGEKSGFFGSAGFYGGRIRPYKGLVSTLSERVVGGESSDSVFASYGKDLASSAFHFAEFTKARVLLDSIAESSRRYDKTELAPDIREKEKDLVGQYSVIEGRWEDIYKNRSEYVERRNNLKKELDSLIVTLRKDYPLYAALHYPSPVRPEELPLKDNEILLEYAVGDDACYVFLADVQKGARPDVRRLVKIPIGKTALEEKIKAFMEPMNTRRIGGFSVKQAKELYDLLLADVLKDVNSRPPSFDGEYEDKKIIIVPDGILGLLPFDALVIKETGDVKDSLYVGDRYSISYYQSATILALKRSLKERETEKTLFALGNPVFSDDDPRYIAWKKKQEGPVLASLDKYSFRGLAIKSKWGKTTEGDTTGSKVEFRPLPETEIEVKGIANIMGVPPGPPDVLLSVMANETNLKTANLEKYRYIHFATHASLPGMLQGINEPFILLSQVENREPDDGFLTLSEVMGLTLNADAVVLSACVTGVGKEMEGEGVANFARAFQHAGAKSVVVSLWEVASDPAAEYMKLFYGYLNAGKGRIDALRLARSEIKAKYPDPFFWAVFILHGEG